MVINFVALALGPTGRAKMLTLIIDSGFGHGDYIRESISMPNWHQTIWTQILERDVCLDGKCGCRNVEL